MPSSECSHSRRFEKHSILECLAWMVSVPRHSQLSQWWCERGPLGWCKVPRRNRWHSEGESVRWRFWGQNFESHLVVVDWPETFVAVFVGPDFRIHAIFVEEIFQTEKVCDWESYPNQCFVSWAIRGVVVRTVHRSVAVGYDPRTFLTTRSWILVVCLDEGKHKLTDSPVSWLQWGLAQAIHIGLQAISSRSSKSNKTPWRSWWNESAPDWSCTWDSPFLRACWSERDSLRSCCERQGKSNTQKSNETSFETHYFSSWFPAQTMYGT